MRLFRNLGLLLLFGAVAGTAVAQGDWSLKTDKIVSKWAKEVKAEAVLPEYPRPQLQRSDWMNLNGLWEYAVVKNGVDMPAEFEGKILVPFAIESALSGVQKRISDKDYLWYKRTFELPTKWKKKDIVLNFGAVDWETTVYVNGKKVGSHQGGYDPFSFDITNALSASGPQEIVVSVWDPASNGTQPRGKQVTKPNGIWYTPVSGIWQTVWLEPVAKQAVGRLKITPDIDGGQVHIETMGRLSNVEGYQVKLEVFDGEQLVKTAQGNLGDEQLLDINAPKLWSPDSPFLYDLKVSLLKKGKTVDQVKSYFAMRKISVGTDKQGHERLLLNNKPLFQLGTLDQGWWPGGLYTAPSDEALRYDIEITQQSGFNMIRKHVKVEPARWYYHCDKMGMLVWQDMPSGDKSADWRGPSGYDGREMKRSANSANQFRKEWKAIMDANYHFPSIVMWVPFNEAWGQFNTVEIINWTMKYDPSRLVNGPSGGNFFPAGHTVDQHQYPGPGMPNARYHSPEIMDGRVLVLGEFGGLGMPVKGHLWQKDRNWGYRNYDDKDRLMSSYQGLIEKIPALIKKGLSAAIYTQTTDVEGEVNGLMTYDREIIKMELSKMKEVNSKLYKVSIDN
ncbi:beta-galactosidase [Puteibacter caeruleilacunae]|nr:beta-galactosidase [Puteibacter caeruleilacunae]